MNKRQLRQKVYDNLYKQFSDLYDSFSQEQAREAFIQSQIDLHIKEEINSILKNAVFSSPEFHQISLFEDPDNPALPSDEELQKKLQEQARNRVETLEAASDTCQEKLQKAREAYEKTLRAETKPKKKTKKSAGRSKPERIDLTEVHDLGEIFCEHCGQAMVHIGYKSRIKYRFEPSKILVVEEKYETKACPNKCTDENGKSVLITARPEEPDLIDRSPATPMLVAALAYYKLLLGVPAYRIEKAFKQLDIPLSRQTIGNITIFCAVHLLHPLTEKMLMDLRKLSVSHADETGLKCLELRDTNKVSAMVVAASGPFEENQMTVYRFSENKKQTFVHDLLGEDYQGALMSDGLRAYANYPSGTKLNCMAHAKRKITEAIQCRDDIVQLNKITDPQQRVDFLKGHPGLNVLLTADRLISELYAVENVFNYDPEELLLARKSLSAPIFDELVRVMEDINEGFTEGSKASKAAKYFLEREDGLSRFLEDGHYPIDNNKAERAVKPFVMARKNFLFSNSAEGARAAADYMTLLISAQNNGLNPLKYLEYVLDQMKYYKDCPDVPEEVLNRLVPYSRQLPKELYQSNESE